VAGRGLYYGFERCCFFTTHKQSFICFFCVKNVVFNFREDGFGLGGFSVAEPQGSAEDDDILADTLSN
jgi:hypothetical protein